MRSFLVNLSKVDSVKEFCAICNGLDFDMDVRSGSYVVDAKSVLGVFSLRLSDPVTVFVGEDNYDEAFELLHKFRL